MTDALSELNELLTEISPELFPGNWVFCSVSGELRDIAHLTPFASVWEPEGLSVILRREVALVERLTFEGVFRLITLTVQSSLTSVGLTAAVSSVLARREIPVNVVAGCYHDHLFVPSDRAEDAFSLLMEMQNGTLRCDSELL